MHDAPDVSDASDVSDVCDVQVFWAAPRPPQDLTALLDPADHAHLSWLRSARARAESATARALLRAAARDGLGAEPTIIRTCPECGRAHGRPEVDGLHASASHTDGLVLVALSDVAPVGVDVERVDAERFAAITVDGHRGTRRTAQEWTRREAAFKAARTPGPFDAEQPIAADTVPLDLDVGAGYAAAVCLAGHPGPSVRLNAADELLSAWAASPRTATA